CTWALEDYW
nr:immunoglobulin heavy chain junction region [Mus musculus]MBK4195211.1 immunoglobulin heavy chain junction region [Mus musculus]